MYSCFSNKVAVVTGAAQGIGKVIADELQAAGARVARLDISFDDQPEPSQFHLDVSRSDDVRDVIARIETDLGPITFCAHAAAILRLGSVLELDGHDWLESFAVNTHGAFHLCQAVARRMVERQEGSLVVVGSNAAHVPRSGMAAYAASKAATEHMVRCLGLESARYNVRCNAVSPGSTYTDMQRQCWRTPDDEQRVIDGDPRQFRLGIPLGRIAEPLDIARAVLFLLSDHARHITLETLTVDAGATLGC